jgi:transposase
VIAVPGGRGKGKATVAALACYRPGHRSRLIYRLHIWRGRKGEPKSFAWEDYRDLLIAAHHQLPGGKIVLAWDNLNVHLHAQMQAFIDATDWLTVFPLPPYAPQLNPVEGIWSVLTRTVLANLAATGLDHLITVIKHGLKRLQYRPGLIDGCLAETGLALTSR